MNYKVENISKYVCSCPDPQRKQAKRACLNYFGISYLMWLSNTILEVKKRIRNKIFYVFLWNYQFIGFDLQHIVICLTRSGLKCGVFNAFNSLGSSRIVSKLFTSY